MYDRMHEQITVTAEFSPRKIKVVSFLWRNKVYEVTGMHLISRASKGRETIWMFSISTKSAAFKLRFDTEELEWYMEELVWDERVDGMG